MFINSLRTCPKTGGWTGNSAIHNQILSLKGLDTLGRFSAILYKGDNFYEFLFALLAHDPNGLTGHKTATESKSCLLSCAPKPFWKGIYSKGKEFAPVGCKFFPFRVDPFSEWKLNSLADVLSWSFMAQSSQLRSCQANQWTYSPFFLGKRSPLSG